MPCLKMYFGCCLGDRMLRDPNATCQGGINLLGPAEGEQHVVGCHPAGDKDEIQTVC